MNLPLKKVLNSHHFEKIVALQTIHNLIIIIKDSEEALTELIRKISSRLACKTNEPIPIQIKKLNLMSFLYELSG